MPIFRYHWDGWSGLKQVETSRRDHLNWPSRCEGRRRTDELGANIGQFSPPWKMLNTFKHCPLAGMDMIPRCIFWVHESIYVHVRQQSRKGWTPLDSADTCHVGSRWTPHLKQVNGHDWIRWFPAVKTSSPHSRRGCFPGRLDSLWIPRRHLSKWSDLLKILSEAWKRSC